MSAPHIIRCERIRYESLNPTVLTSRRHQAITVNGRSWYGTVSFKVAKDKPTEIYLDDNRCWDETHLYIGDTLSAIDHGILHDLPLYFPPKDGF